MEVDTDDNGNSSSSSVVANIVVVHLEVCLGPGNSGDKVGIQELASDWYRSQVSCETGGVLTPGRRSIDFKSNAILSECVDEIIAEVEGTGQCWEAEIKVYVYQLNDEGPYDETTEDDPTSSVFTHWELPAKQFDGLWESLMFEVGVKDHLLEFASTSLLFSSLNVDPNIISWNHVVLLYGPPGTGKTSLCQALSQKLSIRLGDHFKSAQLLEINSHSLFSKWFSESGKLVSKLFSYVHELAEDEDTLVCILIDEVESLAAARSASISGSEPSDSIRVVNALLTQIDRLKSRRNVMILTTSNITEAIDVAFVDRADIRQFIGLPPPQVKEKILLSCIRELMRAGVIDSSSGNTLNEEQLKMLKSCAALTEGISGRALRKLPFQAHARFVRKRQSNLDEFLKALERTGQEELASMKSLQA